MNILNKIQEKIKPQSKFVGAMVLIVVVTSSLSFLMGFLTSQDVNKNKQTATIANAQTGSLSPSEKQKVVINTDRSRVYFDKAEERLNQPKTVMASVNGTRYYPDDCEAGKSIKPENQIWFINENEAKLAGYSIAKACE